MDQINPYIDNKISKNLKVKRWCMNKFLHKFQSGGQGVDFIGNWCKKVALTSGAETNLKVGAPVRSESGGTDPAQSAVKKFLGHALHFLALKAQLVVLVSAFVMVSTVWSVSCLLFFYSRCPPCPASCKSGEGACVPRAPWSRCRWR